eukprot:TRINITY_DN14446_c0_g1_i1.p1 TRINITY_DN14446_c0_g1~~TRINITY_DN14446_c0_g1_i1.p1  ORF type:complete len:245 (+),score=55.43 TRINITY_DN14446_c0_g1_i1:83-736(+)
MVLAALSLICGATAALHAERHSSAASGPSTAEPVHRRRARVLVVYYSETNHTARLAEAIAEGAATAACAPQVRLLRTAEANYSEHVLWSDAVIVGSPVHNGDLASAVKLWLDTWDYLRDDLSQKIAAPFVTGGHLYGGIEHTLKSLAGVFEVFAMRVEPAERSFQPLFPFGVGATTGDPPFNSSVPGNVDGIFLAAGRSLGARIAGEAEAALGSRER